MLLIELKLNNNHGNISCYRCSKSETYGKIDLMRCLIYLLFVEINIFLYFCFILDYRRNIFTR